MLNRLIEKREGFLEVKLLSPELNPENSDKKRLYARVKRPSKVYQN